jgi:hypothetical protein
MRRDLLLGGSSSIEAIIGDDTWSRKMRDRSVRRDESSQIFKDLAGPMRGNRHLNGAFLTKSFFFD